MEAASFHQATDGGNITWREVPNLGRTHSAMMTIPVTAEPSEPGGDSPHLNYMFLVRDTGMYTIRTYLSPTLDFHHQGGLRFAVSVDNGSPVMVQMHPPDRPYLWNRWVSNNIIEASAEIRISQPGVHTLKWWRVDGAVVPQKIVIAPSGMPVNGALGPTESSRL
jgi:hypothetical protein